MAGMKFECRAMAFGARGWLSYLRDNLSRGTGVLSLALAVASTGCTKVGPDFEPLPAPAAETWIEAEEEPKINEQAADVSAWWTVFDDPVLNELVERASKQNLTLQIAGVRILEARARLGIAIGDQYPQVQDAVGGYDYNRASKNAPNSAGGNRSFGAAGIGLDASWEIDFWGRFQRGIESADAALGAQIADYDDLLVSLTAEVARTYVLVREFEERIVLVKGNIEIQKRTLEITDAQFRGGQVTELDVQQSKALLHSTEALLPTFEASRRQATNALSVLLGLPPQDLKGILGAQGVIPTAPPEVAIGIPAELLRRRPDIRRAELDAASQSARIGVAEADLYPRFTLAGFIGFETSHNGGRQSNNASLTDLFDGDSFTGFIGPSVSLPLFNYGRLTNNVRVEDARFQQLVINYQDAVLRAYQEVEDAIAGFLNSQQQSVFLASGVTASQRSVDLALLQYREGLVDYTRVLNAQEFLVAQQDDLANSRSLIAQGLIGIYRGLGGGWQLRGENEFVPEAIEEQMRARTDWGDILPASDLDTAPRSGEDADTRDNLFRRPDW
jgi:NodT family efflux transporter outer membrane factor (OMF) lipoprotein